MVPLRNSDVRRTGLYCVRAGQVEHPSVMSTPWRSRSPTRRADSSTSMPPPEPRSRTRLPGRRAATGRVAAPQAGRHGLGGQLALLVRVVEARPERLLHGDVLAAAAGRAAAGVGRPSTTCRASFRSALVDPRAPRWRPRRTERGPPGPGRGLLGSWWVVGMGPSLVVISASVDISSLVDVSTNVTVVWHDGGMPSTLPLTDERPGRHPGRRAMCCTPVARGVVGVQEAEQLARMFKAPVTRRGCACCRIAASAGQEACVCDLIGPVGLSQPTVSHHMKQPRRRRSGHPGAARTVGVLPAGRGTPRRLERRAAPLTGAG